MTQPYQTELSQKAMRILRRRQVEAMTGLSRSSIYDFIKAGAFPPPIRLGEQAVGWIESEIENWISARVQQSRPSSYEMGGRK